MTECVLCEKREKYYEMVAPSKVVTWELNRNDGRSWAMDVTIENVKLGIALTASIPIDCCPDCGKELE